MPIEQRVIYRRYCIIDRIMLIPTFKVFADLLSFLQTRFISGMPGMCEAESNIEIRIWTLTRIGMYLLC